LSWIGGPFGVEAFDVLTSFGPKIEMRLAIVGGMEALHDVGPFLLSPLMELGILQKSAKFPDFANYRFQEIASTSSFADEAPHSQLVLQNIPRILSLVNVSCENNIVTSGFPRVMCKK
jgi:hypothetical protein